ncbi:MAG: DUF2232 domain-containing protein [Cyanobacteria bacterium J06632_3]
MTLPVDASDFPDEPGAGDAARSSRDELINKSSMDDDEPWISDDLTPDELTFNISGAASTVNANVSAKTKHSAELFPIPPAIPSASGANAISGADVISTLPATSVAPPSATGPLSLVETAFLASAASLMWLINTYFPPGPLLRILFPLPIALVYLRWNVRSAWMAATVSGLLLTILLGPTRSVLFVMPYGFLGVQLGYLWRRRAPWEVSILTGGLLVALGSFFRIWLLSWLAGEDFWGYSIAQITQLIGWGMRVLTNWGWIGLGALGQPSPGFIAIAAIIMVVFASIVYMFTVHLAAWLVLERLNVTMPEPPGWVQVLIDE